jgi:hypothetical protein
MSEVLKRHFSSDVQERLFPDNTFYATAQSDAAGIDTLEIEIPQDEDGDIEVIENPTKFPIESMTEEDKRLTYGAKLLVTRPHTITWENQLLTSYDKRAAKSRKHEGSIQTQLANNIMHDWATTKEAFKFLTSGASRTASAPGATGNRKRAVDTDFLKVFSLFNSLNIPMEQRIVVVNSAIFEDLITISKDYVKGSDTKSIVDSLMKGAMGQIYGFNVFMRSQTTSFTNDAVPLKKAPKAAKAATDCASAIFFHPKFVRYIKGTVMVNADPYNKPELAGGRNFNLMVRGGGATSRLSETGVAALIEDEA